MIKKQQKLQISDLWLVCWLYKNRRCKASFTKYNIFQTFPKHFPSWMGIPLGNSPFDRTENALILAEVKSPVSREIWRSVALAVFRRIVVEYASYYGQNRNYNFYPPKKRFSACLQGQRCAYFSAFSRWVVLACIFQKNRFGKSSDLCLTVNSFYFVRNGHKIKYPNDIMILKNAQIRQNINFKTCKGIMTRW